MATMTKTQVIATSAAKPLLINPPEVEMSDLARLLMTVDASGLKQGEQALDSLAAKGAQTEARVANSNRAISRGMDSVGSSARRMGPQVQNASYQVGDFFVQIASGQSATMALAQQLPQLLGGFGAVGAALGAAVAIGGALVPMLFSGADGAEEMGDRLEDLNTRLSDYLDLADMANASTLELYEKFGDAAGAARETYKALMEIKRIEYLEAMASTVKGLSDDLDGLRGAMTRYQGAVAASDGMGEDKVLAMQIAVNDLKGQFGLTVEQAEKVNDALSAMGAAQNKGPRAAADAAKALGDELMNAYEAGGRTNAEILDAAKSAYQFQIEASSAAQVMGDVADGSVSAADAAAQATAATEDWAAAMAAVSAEISAIASSLMSMGSGAISNASKFTELAALRSGRSVADSARARQRQQSDAEFDAREMGAGSWLERMIIRGDRALTDRGFELDEELDAARSAARERDREANRKARGGSKGRKPKADRLDGYERSVIDIQSETAAFLAQADAMAKVVAAGGDWERALAVIEEEQKLLNAAQKAGVELTPEVRDGIKEMAEAYVDAEDKLDRIRTATEKGQDAFKDLFGSILDGVDGAKDALAQLLEQIAKVQFAKGAMGLLGQTSWGGGLVAGIGDLLSFDGGGYTGGGPRTGGLDGKGGYLAMIHPQETITDHTKGQSAGGSRVHVTVGIDDSGNLQVRKIAQEEASNMGRAVSAGVPSQIQQYQANPRRR